MINNEIITTKGMEQAQKQVEQAQKQVEQAQNRLAIERKKPMKKGENERIIIST